MLDYVQTHAGKGRLVDEILQRKTFRDEEGKGGQREYRSHFCMHEVGREDSLFFCKRDNTFGVVPETGFRSSKNFRHDRSTSD